ncbi:hypothetical protein [Bacillus sp. CRN 9]|uniref:hypothetical protein n=1 Tax=Cytobacillus horneckiae TaxID=549687 RepID=UPI001562CB49|nr:hypothetical protein [Bacillus sp. CRN 9]
MNSNNLKALMMTSFLFLIAGLFSMFSLAHNSAMYDINFVIIGGILFGAGVLLAIMTLFTFALKK